MVTLARPSLETTRGEAQRVEGRAHRRQVDNSTAPEPISASVSQYWEGNDGPWSSFAIQVGTRAQNVRVLPSTASPNTWVVYSEGCPTDAPSNCPDLRGGTFNPNNSLTWIPNSIFNLGIDDNLDYNVFGDFGFDTVTLGWQGSNGPSVEHSIVAGIADTSFSWLGVLGLNPRPTNFSTFPNSPQPSFVQLLKDKNSIPSVSWAYTAGAQYRLDKVFGSLTLGGYDESRFNKPSATAQTLTFPFYTDIARDLLVGISSITTSKTVSSSSESKLLSDGIFAFIDTTLPYLWLPTSVCESFENAFGLTWNSTTELYTLNATQHSTLSKLDPTITFNLSPNLPASANDQSVSISFPYSAFDLNVSWPYAETSTYYFPLKRASNDTQFTLGRAFLQEAYLIADYERQNFSIWPCKWDAQTTKANIVPILSKDAKTNSSSPNDGGGGETTSPSSGKGLGSGAIAGIAVGCAIVGIVAIIALWIYLRRRKASNSKGQSVELEGSRAHKSVAANPVEANGTGVIEAPMNEKKVAAPEELEGSYPVHGEELESHSKYLAEVDGRGMRGPRAIYEIGDGTIIHEADGTGTKNMGSGPSAVQPYAGPERRFSFEQEAGATAGPVPAWSERQPEKR